MTDTEQVEKAVEAIQNFEVATDYSTYDIETGDVGTEPLGRVLERDHGIDSRRLRTIAKAALASTPLEPYREALEEIAGTPEAQGPHDLYGIPEIARKALGKEEG